MLLKTLIAAAAAGLIGAALLPPLGAFARGGGGHGGGGHGGHGGSHGGHGGHHGGHHSGHSGHSFRSLGSYGYSSSYASCYQWTSRRGVSRRLYVC